MNNFFGNTKNFSAQKLCWRDGNIKIEGSRARGFDDLYFPENESVTAFPKSNGNSNILERK